MAKTHIKVFLKKETSVVDCLQLIKDLMANNFVEKAKIFSGIFPETKKKTEPLTPTQEKLQRKYQETERFLALLQNSGANDQER